MNKQHRLTEYLTDTKLITDGSFGTYFSEKYDTNEMPELSNTDNKLSGRVLDIHKEYIEAGARLIRTNTFAANMQLLNANIEDVKNNIKAAIGIANEAVKTAGENDKEYFIAGDIGPIPIIAENDIDNARNQYMQICKTFLENDIDILTFETFSELETILPVIKEIKTKAANEQKPLFIMVQFSVNQFGYSSAGLSAKKLIKKASETQEIDAVGLNCGVGPGHMEQIISGCIDTTAGKYIIALPNAGYPQRIRNQVRFVNHPDYFADKAVELATKDGADIVGGCCGTTPRFISLLSSKLDTAQTPKKVIVEKKSPEKENVEKLSFFANKADKKDKLIAVELAPPATADDRKLLEAAHMLEDLGVDVLTFPDSPSGRTRIDSVLMAGKVHKETGMCVMPHICCRDKNAIAMRSTLLGAHINDIHNFLIITGDPIPTMARQTTKAVFNFDAVGLMNIAHDMNEENFENSPLTYGGAINQGRRNLEVEINRVKKKMEAGAEFFLTQPIFTKEDAERVHRIKDETNARILCGIMPLISRKNATFMKNEIAGVNVTDEIINRYPPDADKVQGEQIGIELAKEIMNYTKDFTDGYYFSFPFNRVYMLKKIIKPL